jgi:hypothetical protein
MLAGRMKDRVPQGAVKYLLTKSLEQMILRGNAERMFPRFTTT